jgi:hypothetical protein
MADEQNVILSPSPVPPNSYLPIAGESFPPGSPVAQIPSPSVPRTVQKAKADAADTTNAVGLAAKVGIEDLHAHVQFAGPLTLTTAEWDVITGGSGGLVVGVPYYLSNATAGKMSTSLPGSGFVKQLGIATAPETLMIQLGPATPVIF